MKTQKKSTTLNRLLKFIHADQLVKHFVPLFIITFLMGLGTLPASAHCDSYDGPTVQDAVKALESNNVNLVLKWISKDQEAEVIALFNKTYKLRNGDPEIYALVEKHFLETLVRLHRETEGAPFTGLKPAGTTQKIVQLSDHALAVKDFEGLIGKLNSHIESVLREKYQRVARLDAVKEDSPEKGREYVEAYVDYTHRIEALHAIIEGGAGHSHAAHQH